jgi:diguanylate cyclase (GGDEF)-like protein
VSSEPVSVVLIGLDDDAAAALGREELVTVERRAALEPAAPLAADVVVVAIADGAPLDTVRSARVTAPDAAIVVVTEPDREADGAIALHAGAEDHLVRDETFLALLPRAVRYAVTINRMRRELVTIDEATALPNLRGFAPIAEHHLRLADRSGRPAVFVFVRLDDVERRGREEGPGAADDLARQAAAVVIGAVRDADVPARISADTIAVLLTGEAAGAESLVLSRLVEAMAVLDASRSRPGALALSVGTARYEPGSGAGLAEILESAVRGLAARA